MKLRANFASLPKFKLQIFETNPNPQMCQMFPPKASPVLKILTNVYSQDDEQSMGYGLLIGCAGHNILK